MSNVALLINTLIYITSLSQVMLRFYVSLFAILITCAAALARTVQGVVLSATDSTAVVGATCMLVANDKTIAGNVSDANGAFAISTDARSALTLNVSATGFASTTIIIEAGSKDINVGQVWLDEAVNALNEVTVTAGSFVNSQGRTIVFPSASEVRASSSANSLFQKLPLPGLEADPINRTLSVDGGTPYILINGIPSTIADVNALQPKDIAKIEYSRFTPARYADSGTKGFLNITLKQRNDGGQIYMWARSALSTAFVDASIQASYHQGASQFTLSYNPTWRNYQEVYDNSYESYIAPDFTARLETHDRAPFNYQQQGMRFKYDFSPDANTLFSATFRINPGSDKARVIGHTDDSQLGSYDFENIRQGSDRAPSLDLFVRHNFNSKNSLEAQVVGTLSSGSYTRDNHYTYANGLSDNYLVDVDSRRRSLITALNYVHDFNHSNDLTIGAQNTLSHSTNSYISSDYKPVLTENNNYLYARYGQNIGKVYLSLSTGAKLFWIENDLNKRHFIRNLSTVMSSWQISGQWSLAAAAQYSPYIPSLTALTDYPQQTSPYIISNGNPDLKVSDYVIFQCMPTFKYRKLQASLLVNQEITYNPTVQEVRYLGSGMFLSQSINASNSASTMASLNVRMNDLGDFGFNTTIRYYHFRTTFPEWKKCFNTIDAAISVWWNHGPYTITYWYKVPGKFLDGTTVTKNENGNSLTFEYKAGKHWNFGASWMYIFDRKGTRYPSWDYSPANPGRSDRFIKNNSNMVTLSVTYSADFGTIFRTGSRSLNNSDNGSSVLKM